MAFKKITRINRNGEERELIVNLDNVIELTEIASEEVPSKWDSDTGEVVETKKVSRYVLGFDTGKTYEITPESYSELAKALL